MRKWDEADCEAGSLISRGPIPGGRGSLPLMAQIRMVLCSAPDGLPLVCRPVSCACRNLRIRTRVTLGRVEVQAPDLRGHWAHKDENSVDPALILRLRQNRAYGPSGTVYNLPSSPQIRGGTRPGPRQGRCQRWWSRSLSLLLAVAGHQRASSGVWSGHQARASVLPSMVTASTTHPSAGESIPYP